MPLLVRTDCGVENDRHRDQDLETGFLELQVRRDEGRKAKTDSKSSKNEVEDMPASVGLREVRREAVRPAVGFLEQVDLGRNMMRLGAAGAIPAPLIADLRLRMTRRQVTSAKWPHAGCGEQ